MRILAFLLLAAPAQDDAKFTEWIRELGDDSIEARDAAFEKLVKAGRSAEKALKLAAKGTNPEIVERAARALNEIARGERAGKFDAGPSPITLRVDGAPLGRVLDEIQRQTSTKLSRKDIPGEALVSLELDRVPLFQALDALCRKHGGITFKFAEDWDENAAVLDFLATRGREADPVVQVTAGNHSAVPAAMAEQFMVRLTRIQLSTQDNLKGPLRATTSFTFEWGCEKGTRPRGSKVVVEELQDEAGNSYAAEFKVAAQEFDANEMRNGFSQGIRYANASMNKVPPESVMCFTLFKGRFEVILPEAEEAWSFDAPEGAKDAVRKSAAGEVTLQGLTRDGGVTRGTLVTRPAKLADQLKIRVVGKDGTEYGYGRMSGSGDDERMEYSLDFDVPAGVELKALVCSARTGSKVKKVPFEFKDLRIRR